MMINRIFKLSKVSKLSKLSTRSATQAKKTSTFKALKDSTKEEWHIVCKEYNIGVIQQTHNRLIALIESQRGDDKKYGHPVDLYQHQLQTASRAYRDGADEEIIVMGLFHDAAEYLTPHNHGHTIGNMLYPYLSPKAFWMLSHHDIFQTYYYIHHYGQDSDILRGQFKDNPYFADTVYFCENYDQNSFDAGYDSFTLEKFEPMIERFFKQPAFWWNDGVNPRSGAGTLYL
mmetsp:Transcript_64998/g.58362  ORF Transcript_64998/g.58362 Transcript_64998/m.58362 type:complete len:230 (-) Transcript_64998:91-780(-)